MTAATAAAELRIAVSAASRYAICPALRLARRTAAWHSAAPALPNAVSALPRTAPPTSVIPKAEQGWTVLAISLALPLAPRTAAWHSAAPALPNAVSASPRTAPPTSVIPKAEQGWTVLAISLALRLAPRTAAWQFAAPALPNAVSASPRTAPPTSVIPKAEQGWTVLAISLALPLAPRTAAWHSAAPALPNAVSALAADCPAHVRHSESRARVDRAGHLAGLAPRAADRRLAFRRARTPERRLRLAADCPAHVRHPDRKGRRSAMTAANAILNSLWQTAAAAALVWLALWAAAELRIVVNAATRYAIWWTVLAISLALPFAPQTTAWHSAAPTPLPAVSAPPRPAPIAREIPPAPRGAILTVEARRSSPWPFCGLALWGAVFLFRLARLAAGYRELRGIKRRAKTSDRRLPSLARPARLLLSAEIASPMAAGFLHAAVLLPESLPGQLTPAELDCILLHESAHLARRDDWMHLLGCLLGAALALHPVAWWILRQIEREREMACDDWVVAQTGAARAYALSLARMSDLRQPRPDGLLAAGIFGSRSRLGDRIAMLLARGRDFSPRISIARVAVVAAALLALAMAAAPARWIGFAQRVEFEVASVKPSGEDSGRMGIGLFTFPGGRIRANYVPLDYLIGEAFDIQRFQIVDAPRWTHEERFDLEARPPASSESSHANPRISKLPPNPEQRRMLQALLEGRFQLKWRRETKEGPVYFLVKTDRPLRLEPTKDPEQYPWVGSVAGGGIGDDGLAATNATIALMAARLSNRLDRQVIDRTGLEGAFDFKYPLPQNDPPPDVMTDIFTSLQGIGLKLEAGKGPIETIVIEHVERPKGN